MQVVFSIGASKRLCTAHLSCSPIPHPDRAPGCESCVRDWSRRVLPSYIRSQTAIWRSLAAHLCNLRQVPRPSIYLHAEAECRPHFSVSLIPPCHAVCCTSSIRLVSFHYAHARHSYLLSVFSLANSAYLNCKTQRDILAQSIQTLTKTKCPK